MIEYTVRLFSDTNGFKPTTFSEWVGHAVQITGLDSGYRHILRSVQVPDSSQVILTINTYPEDQADTKHLTPSLSVTPGTPRAQVRVYTEEGTHLVTAHLDAPLRDLSQIRVDNVLYQITGITYPYRDQDNPENTEDYQLVTAHPVPESDVVTDLGIPPMLF